MAQRHMRYLVLVRHRKIQLFRQVDATWSNLADIFRANAPINHLCRASKKMGECDGPVCSKPRQAVLVQFGPDQPVSHNATDRPWWMCAL